MRILRPGRDPHVSPIEEVPVTVDASDDFGVEGLELHYSVNGGPEQVVPLLKNKGAKEAEGSTTLSFENFKVVPGDLVSFYATARDAKTTSRSDIIFAQAEPFDFKFTQSQQAGGRAEWAWAPAIRTATSPSGRSRSSQRPGIKLRNSNPNRAAMQEGARFLSEVESKLGEQAKTLAERMGNRELSAAQFGIPGISRN